MLAREYIRGDDGDDRAASAATKSADADDALAGPLALALGSTNLPGAKTMTVQGQRLADDPRWSATSGAVGRSQIVDRRWIGEPGIDERTGA